MKLGLTTRHDYIGIRRIEEEKKEKEEKMEMKMGWDGKAVVPFGYAMHV